MINYFQEDIDYQLLNADKINTWIFQTIDNEDNRLTSLSFIFCSDDYLLNINKQYLEHDYYTDIITFDNSDGNSIEGDIFISVDRAKENAHEFGVDLDKEIHRLMIHGTLHLLGYKDGTAEEKKLMTAKEDYYLSLLS